MSAHKWIDNLSSRVYHEYKKILSNEQTNLIKEYPTYININSEIKKIEEELKLLINENTGSLSDIFRLDQNDAIVKRKTYLDNLIFYKVYMKYEETKKRNEREKEIRKLEDMFKQYEEQQLHTQSFLDLKKQLKRNIYKLRQQTDDALEDDYIAIKKLPKLNIPNLPTSSRRSNNTNSNSNIRSLLIPASLYQNMYC